MALSDAQRKAVLKISGDPDGTGERTAEFHMRVGADNPPSITYAMESQFFIDGRGGQILTLLNQIIGDGGAINKSVFLDLGGSVHRIEIDFMGFNGSSLRWGDTGNGGTGTDATGDSALEQVQVLDNWLTTVRIDSFAMSGGGTAVLEHGLYHPNGPLDPLEVVPENPTMVYAGSAPASFDGSLAFIEAADLNRVIDEVTNDGK